MLTQKDARELKKKLEKTKTDLEKEIHELEEKSPDFGNDTDHFEEEESETIEHKTQFGIAHELRKRLADVETALEKIQEHTYGKCENCAKEIEIEMLRIDPESKYCKDCKLHMAKGK